MSNHHRTVPAWRLVVLFVILVIAVGIGRAHAGESAIDLPVLVEGPGVVVRAEAGLDALARAAAGRASVQLAEVSRDLAGLTMPTVVEIRLVKRAEDLSRAAPPRHGAPEWARGVAYPELGLAVVATRRAHEPIDALRVVDHELTHLAVGAALRGRAPRWLDEGFAFLHASDESMGRMNILVGMAWTGNTRRTRRADKRLPRLTSRRRPDHTRTRGGSLEEPRFDPRDGTVRGYRERHAAFSYPRSWTGDRIFEIRVST